MEFNIQGKENPHIKKYHSDDLDIAREFAKRSFKEFGSFLKAIVLFGSHAKELNTHKHETTKKSDIDILIIINDLSTIMTKEAAETYKIIMQRIVIETSPKIHLTTLSFTNFWDLVRNGDPIAINILRDGVALIDTGIFDPLQALLYQGKIRPTWESIWTYYSRAPNTLHNSKAHLLQATLDLYWAVVDSAHAALMKLGEIPPSPAHVADLMDKAMYRKGLVHKRYVTIMRDFHQLSKHIIKREIKEIEGRDYDSHYRDAKDFVDTMRRIIEEK